MGNGVGSLIQKKDLKKAANAPEPHQQWRKPKDLKTIKQQNEQRRKQEEAELDRKKKEEERLRRLKEEWEKEKESGHRHAEEIDGFDDGEGGGAPPPDGGQGGYAQQYVNPGDAEHGIYNDVGNDPGYDGSENYYYEDPAEQALRRAETVGLFNIMEHDEVVPSEYQKREKMKELQKQQKEEEKKRWETQKMLQERQRGSGRQAVSSGFVSAGGNDGDQRDSGQRSQIGFGRKNPTLEMTNSLGKNSSGLDRSPNAGDRRRGSGRSTPTAGAGGGNKNSQFDSVNSAMMLEDEVNKSEKLAVGNLENTIVDAVGRIWEQIMTERKKGGREVDADADLGMKRNYPGAATLNQNAALNQSNPRLGTANSTTVSDSGFGLNRPGAANHLNPAVLLQIKREVEAAAQAIESCENDLETFEQQKYAQIHELDNLVLKIEPNAIQGGAPIQSGGAGGGVAANGYQFQEGEFAVRKGKLCTIEKIHWNEVPPYFEVKACYGSESTVGTEAEKLKALAPVQAGQVRAKMRAIDLLGSKVELALEGKKQAEASLERNNSLLVAEYEKMMASSPSSGGGGGIGGVGPQNGPRPTLNLPPLSAGGLLPAPGQAGFAFAGNGLGTAADELSSRDIKNNGKDALNMTRTRGVATTQIPRPMSSRPAWKPGMAPFGMPDLEVIKKWAPKAETEDPTQQPSSRPGSKTTATSQQHAQQQQNANAAQQQQAAAQQQAQQAQPGNPAPSSRWIPYSTEEGNVFYYNEETGESVWELPENAVVDYTNCQPDETAQQKQQNEEDAYYQQYGYANRQAYEEAYYAAYYAQQESDAQQPQPEDPAFANLREHDAQQAKQQQEWAEWYKQYQAWYGQQQAGAGRTPGQPYSQHQPQHEHQQNQHEHQNQKTANSPPRDPNLPLGVVDPKQKPVLDARFEDRAVYLLKAGILKEMEVMVETRVGIEERKKALRKLKFQWHPDKNPEDQEVAKMVFQFVEECKVWFLLEE